MEKKANNLTSTERLELYNQHIVPYERMIYALVRKYSFDKDNVEDNYNQCLYNFYHNIHTYDPSRSIRTWIHVICKRFVFKLELERSKAMPTTDDYDIENDELFSYDQFAFPLRDITPDNWRSALSDGELKAINSMKPIYIESLLLQMMGYTLKEIADISYQNGNLKTNNIDTIKSRLFLAKKFLKQHLDNDGEYI